MKIKNQHMWIKSRSSEEDTYLFSLVLSSMVLAVSEVIVGEIDGVINTPQEIVEEFFLCDEIQGKLLNKTRDYMNELSSIQYRNFLNYEKNFIEIVPVNKFTEFSVSGVVALRMLSVKYNTELIKYFHRIDSRVPVGLSDSDLRKWFIKRELKSLLKIIRKSGLRECSIGA